MATGRSRGKAEKSSERKRTRNRGLLVDIEALYALAEALQLRLTPETRVDVLTDRINQDIRNRDNPQEHSFIRKIFASEPVDKRSIEILAKALGLHPKEYYRLVRAEFGGPVTPNIPRRVSPHFLGREETLSEIRRQLDRPAAGPRVVVVHGIRGVGKSTLAAAYAYRHKSQYRIVWWIRAETAAAIASDLISLGIRLGWVDRDEQENSALQKVRDRLERDEGPTLLIYDNAIDVVQLKPHLPRASAAHVLATSNSRVWHEVAQTIELRSLPTPVGADFLLARCGRPETRSDALALSQLLGGLPLALEQAAAFCDHFEVSLAEYHRRFEVQPLHYLDDARHAPEEYYEGRSVAKTFTLAIEEALRQRPALEVLMAHAALLPPEPIPLYLISAAAQAAGNSFASELVGSNLEEALAVLRALALIERASVQDERKSEIRTDTMSLHRLVREVAAHRSKDRQHQSRQELRQALGSLYTLTSLADPTHGPQIRLLDPLAFALLASPLSATDDDSAEEIGLCLLMARYRLSSLASLYPQAKHLLERAVAYRQRTLGMNDPATLKIMHDLAFCVRAMGDMPGAIQRYQEVLAIRRAVQGPVHRDTLEVVNHLAFCVRANGEADRAQTMLVDLLSQCEAQLGPDHDDTLLVAGNLGLSFQEKGHWTAAERLHRRVLCGQERNLGPTHGLTLETMINLAHVLRAQGRYDEARDLYQRAANAAEEKYGPEHVITRSARDGLSLVPNS